MECQCACVPCIQYLICGKTRGVTNVFLTYFDYFFRRGQNKLGGLRGTRGGEYNTPSGAPSRQIEHCRVRLKKTNICYFSNLVPFLSPTQTMQPNTTLHTDIQSSQPWNTGIIYSTRTSVREILICREGRFPEQRIHEVVSEHSPYDCLLRVYVE